MGAGLTLYTCRHAFCIAKKPCTSRNYSTSVFSDARSAEFLAAAAGSSSIPRLDSLPEVIVTGRANSGKSTLLNAVLGRTKLLHTSSKPGRTQTLNFYRVGAAPGKLVVVDAPGYGSRGRPEWGELFNHYVQTRQELRRVYILFSASHGLNEVDRAMLQDLEEKASGGVEFTLQAIITKADDLIKTSKDPARMVKELQNDIFETAPTCLPPIVTAALKQPQFGIEQVRNSIADACGLS